MTQDTTITTPFDVDSTADEVIAGVDLTGKRAIVTGGSSGIGVETARALASAGAEVTLAVRNLDAGAQAAQEITASTGNANVTVRELELADAESVRAFVAAWSGPLDILVLNAGVMAEPLTRTPEGWEHQFATNHLGHFRLATGLHDALASSGNARVVALSSRGHLRSPVVFDDIMYENREYDPWEAYGQSKTANVLFAVEAAKRWAGDGITVNAVHPGVIQTNLSRHVSAESMGAVIRATGSHEKSIGQGAATSVLVATWPGLAGVSGMYFEDAQVAGPYVPPIREGVADYAIDPGNAERLWNVSEELLGQSRV